MKVKLHVLPYALFPKSTFTDSSNVSFKTSELIFTFTFYGYVTSRKRTLSAVRNAIAALYI